MSPFQLQNLMARPQEAITDAGAPAASTISHLSYGTNVVYKTVITLTATSVTMADEAGVVAYGSQKVFDFPASLIAILGASTDLDVTKSGSGINADFDGDFALGTAAASNNASLTGTEQNVIASTATPQASSGVTTADGESVSSLTSLTDSTGGVANDTLEDLGTLALSTSNTYTDAAVNTAVNAILAKVENCLADLAAKVNAVIANVNGLKAVVVDGTTTAADLFLNFLIDDGDQDGGGTLSVTGTITLVWISLGDN